MAARSRWRSWLLVSMMGLAGVTILWWIAGALTTYREQTDTHARSNRMVELRGQILQLDEVLTMSALMRAATGAASWEARYNEYDPLLGAAIDEICQLSQASGLPPLGQETREANNRLVEMERRSFGLDRERALELLGSAEYQRQKAIYTRGMTRLSGGLQEALLERLAREQQRLIVRVAVAGGLLAVLVWSLVVVVRRLRQRGDLLLGEVQTGRQALQASQEMLLQAQKMEAIGQLAGGVAHDFNNLLCAINGFTSLALEQLPMEHPATDSLLEIGKAGQRASALTRQLLAFSRRQHLKPKALELNAVVKDMEGMLRRLIGENIRMRLISGGGRLGVMADPGQLQQVILNLVVNARDAMAQGGELRIETGMEGGRARVAVIDSGVGMDAATQSRLFEPFFTTKGLGCGTGLGLSTAYGIAKQSGGDIVVRSSPGEGSAFTLWLPLVAGEAAGAAEERGQVRRGTERILLVEDEEQVRRLAASVLRSRGYRVEEAIDGAAALERLGKGKGKGQIDLLVTDVIMPGMNGRELVRHARVGRPWLRVLYMSGYTDNQLGDAGEEAFLQKPFSVEELATKVRAVLDE